MVKIYGRYELTKPTGLVTPAEEDQCDFTLNRDSWEKKQPTQGQIDTWECPYQSSADSDFCILHRHDDRDESELASFINNKIDEYPDVGRYEFIGARVQNLDLSRIDLNSDRNYSVLDFRHSVISGDVELVNTQNSLDLCLDGSVIGGRLRVVNSAGLGRLSFKDCLFSGEGISVTMYESKFDEKLIGENSVFQGRFHINSVEFSDKVELSESYFCDRTTIQDSKLDDRLHMRDCQFCFLSEDGDPENSIYGSDLKHVSTHGSVFRGALEADTITVDKTFMAPGVTFNDLVSFEYSDINVLDFANVHLPKNVNLTSADISEIQIRGPTILGDESILDFSSSKVRGGYIHQADTGDLLLDFSAATVGELSLKPDRSIGLLSSNSLSSMINVQENKNNPLYNCRFFKTKFKNFDFANYLGELEDIDWEIHKLKDEEISDVEREFVMKRPDSTESFTVEGEAMNPASLATTYANAKEGASSMGAHQISSEFLIKEMQYRKAHYRRNTINSLQNGSFLSTWHNGMKWSINSFLEVSCGYGERLWAPIIYSILTVVNFAFLFPLIGGFSNSEIQYNVESLSEVPFSELIVESLYFSTVTFTTLGYGDYQPTTIISKLAAGLESFIGTFLIALLIFTVGRKMTG